jgi:hypothetical protein
VNEHYDCPNCGGSLVWRDGEDDWAHESTAALQAFRRDPRRGRRGLFPGGPQRSPVGLAARADGPGAVMTRFRFQGTGETAGGDGRLVLLVIVLLLLGSGGAVAAVTAAVVTLLVAAVVVVLACAVAMLVFAVWRHRHPEGAARLVPPIRYHQLPGAERPALGPAEVHTHLHLHGLDAEQVAEVARAMRPDGLG